MPNNLKTAVLLLASIALLFLIPTVRETFMGIISLFQSLDIEAIKAYILSFGLLAPLVSFALMVCRLTRSSTA
jgi:hypothetical protein